MTETKITVIIIIVEIPIVIKEGNRANNNSLPNQRYYDVSDRKYNNHHLDGNWDQRNYPKINVIVFVLFGVFEDIMHKNAMLKYISYRI